MKRLYFIAKLLNPPNRNTFKYMRSHHFGRVRCHALSTLSSKSASMHKQSTSSDLITNLDVDYLVNVNNREKIQQNITNRKGVGDIDSLLSAWRKLQSVEQSEGKNSQSYLELKQEFLSLAADIPNKTHPQVVIGDESQARLVSLHNEKKEFDFPPRTAEDIAVKLGLLRTKHVGVVTGPKTHFFKNELVMLERALVNFTLDKLQQKGFSFLSVPNLVHPDTVEGCGFKTTGTRTQVYKLNPELHGNICLAGTGEIPIAGFNRNKIFHIEELPQRFATVSRCYRAEASEVGLEGGLYRVHQFTKVEMFGITPDDDGTESETLLHELLATEKELFSLLGLHFRVLEMPSEELGAAAYHKYDVEAWMPARAYWGEISSASNCTDFQSRRLNIRYQGHDGQIKFVHTVNGTACAVPRMIISILENYQQRDGTVVVPKALQPFMDGISLLTHRPHFQTRFIRLTRDYKKMFQDR